MREMRRDLEPVWYSNYVSQDALEDQNGYFTGERVLTMTVPTLVMGNVSPPGGEVGLASHLRIEAFGYTKDYKRKVKIYRKCDIGNEARVWIGLPKNISAYRPSCYKVGCLVIKDTGIFRCIAPITTPESWTAAHWESVNHNNIVRRISNAEIHGGGIMIELEEVPS